MKISEPLRFDKARIDGCNWQPNADHGKDILEVSAPLSRGNARAMDAEFLFLSETLPREDAKLAGAKLESVDIEIGLDNNVRVFSPEVITSIKTKAVEDLGIEISFNAHFVGQDGLAVAMLARELNKAEFNLVVRAVIPTQTGPLFDQKQQESEQELPPQTYAKVDGVINWAGKKAAARITVVECEGGWRAGYGASFSHRHPKEIGSEPSEMIAFASEREAIGAAAAKIHEWAGSVKVGAMGNEKSSAIEMIRWAETFMRPEQFMSQPEPVEEAVETTVQ